MKSHFIYFLDAMRLHNFMGHADTNWIEFREITLLFGKNSSGKSALIRALLLLKQSLNSSDKGSPLVFVGEHVDIGTYYNAVIGHQTQKDIKFSFRVSMIPDPPLPNLPIAPTDDQVKDFDAEIERRNQTIADWAKNDAASVDRSPLEISLSYGIINDDRTIYLKEVSIHGYRKMDANRERILIFQAIYEKERKKWNFAGDITHRDFGQTATNLPIQDFWSNTEINCNNSFFPTLRIKSAADSKDKDYPKNLEIAKKALDFFREHVRIFLENIEHLPPLREEAKRYYRDDTKWVRSFVKANSYDDNDINNWLNDIKLNSTAKLETLNKNEGLVGLYISEAQEKNQSFKSNLRDVGAGLAQAFPIIARSISAINNSLVIIEQPELHLHPLAQAELADAFIRMTHKDKRFLLETHSSSLINRFRRRIAEAQNHENQQLQLQASDLLAVFVERKNGKSICTSLSFNPNGEYSYKTSLLSGFFGVDTNEFTLMKTASVPKEVIRNVEDIRNSLKCFESYFGGDTVEDLFAVLSIHPASAIRMMRVWTEFIVKTIAFKNSFDMSKKDNADLATVIRDLYENGVFDTDTKRLADQIRQTGNSDSHASYLGITNPSISEACNMLSNLVFFLQRLKAKEKLN